MPKAKHRKLPEEVRRAEIILAARTLFAKNGFDRTRMDDVAAMAGLTKGGLYFHFKNKRKLFEAVVAERVEKIQSNVDQMSKLQGPPDEALRTAFGLFVQEMMRTIPPDFHDAGNYYPGFMELFMEGHKLHSHSPMLRRLFRGARAAIAELVERGRRSGLFPAADPEAAAVSAVGQVEGLFYQYGFDPEAFDLKDMGRRLADQFVRGLKAPADGGA